MWGLSSVTFSLDFLNVFGEVLNDYNTNDIAFSKFKAPSAATDTSVVIVNIGELSRAGIAQQIDILNKFDPAVIGIDVEFELNTDPIEDSILAASFANTKNLVLWSKVTDGKPDSLNEHRALWDTLKLVNPMFSKLAYHGYTNALTEGESEFETWRETSSVEHIIDGRKEYSFATKITQRYDSAKAQVFIDRNKDYPLEIINFRGNLDKFTVLDINDVLDTNFVAETIKGKIILMGYLGADTRSKTWDGDKYYSPLNERPVGRVPPDMYGVVVHANIVSMILHNDYIDTIPQWLVYFIAIFMCFVNVALFSWLSESEFWGPWYGIVSKVIQLIEIVGLIYIMLYFFINQNIKLDLTITFLSTALAGELIEIYEVVVQNLSKIFTGKSAMLKGKNV
ncbi:MAG: CHASE2 domain-containing protein [Cytophagales bacterium]|nr:MAG: CHASE2 domain-containing protein [Cytophagales bacterium]